MKSISSGHTLLFSKLRRALITARILQHNPEYIFQKDELVSHTRRDFIKGIGATASLAAISPFLNACGTHSRKWDDGMSPKIAIVGAGMAGLHAAYLLQKAGINARLFEASDRTGGRIFSKKDLLAPGLTTELGGEFIDTGHEDILQLCNEFGLPLIDAKSESELAYKDGYFFDGRYYTEDDVIKAFVKIAPKLEADYESLGEVVSFRESNKAARRLDNTSLSAYIDSLAIPEWLKKLLDIAYLTEYGAESSAQSAINFLYLISADTSQGFKIFGDSDQRYKVLGGNQQITDALTQRLESYIEYEQKLIALRAANAGYTLIFDGGDEVTADIVLLTIPFSILRNIELSVPLPDYKVRAIKELQYGTNAKLLIGTKTRFWREKKLNGTIYTDKPFQLSWDSSLGQPGTEGGFTLFSGGNEGIKVGEGKPEDQINRLMPGLEEALPGFAESMNGNNARFHWPTYPYTRGSYAAYGVGQWTTISGAEMLPVGNLFFAGEHCSIDFQGYMNGAAETGRVAAQGILESLRLASAA